MAHADVKKSMDTLAREVLPEVKSWGMENAA